MAVMLRKPNYPSRGSLQARSSTSNLAWGLLVLMNLTQDKNPSHMPTKFQLIYCPQRLYILDIMHKPSLFINSFHNSLVYFPLHNADHCFSMRFISPSTISTTDDVNRGWEEQKRKSHIQACTHVHTHTHIHIETNPS